jgi:hypothetical protein
MALRHIHPPHYNPAGPVSAGIVEEEIPDYGAPAPPDEDSVEQAEINLKNAQVALADAKEREKVAKKAAEDAEARNKQAEADAKDPRAADKRKDAMRAEASKSAEVEREASEKGKK